MPLTPTLPLPLSPSFSPTATHSIPFTSSHSIFSSFRRCDSMCSLHACVCVYMNGYFCVGVVTYVLCQPVCGLLPLNMYRSFCHSIWSDTENNCSSFVHENTTAACWMYFELTIFHTILLNLYSVVSLLHIHMISRVQLVDFVIHSNLYVKGHTKTHIHLQGTWKRQRSILSWIFPVWCPFTHCLFESPVPWCTIKKSKSKINVSAVLCTVHKTCKDPT